jgi:hypothetical protein
MHTTALTRSTIDSSRNTAQDNGDGVGADARPAGKNKGFVHLLQKLTLEAVLAQPIMNIGGPVCSLSWSMALFRSTRMTWITLRC